MRLATKLTLWLWAAIILVLGINGYDRFRREAALFESDMARDHEVMGRGIAAAIGEVWEDDGKARALDIVERANLREGGIQIRWRDVAEGTAPASVRAAARIGAIASWTDRPSGSLTTWVPLRVNDHFVGVIELAESLEAERSYLQASMLRVGVTTGSLILLAGAITLLIGVNLIGRPVRRLVDKARRVGLGDFAGDVGLTQQDELGSLAGEMDAMARRLAEARVALDAESSGRLAALEQLRHAERVATVGKLASGVAHELGTPLNVISWRARNIATGKVEGERARENARVVVEQSERITRIVRQLLDYARRPQLVRAETNLLALARDSAALLEPVARKAEVVVDVRPDGLDTVVLVDASQLQQVLTNLLLNGIQASPAGGTVRISGRDVTDAEVAITVEDEGCGIAPEHLHLIFDPFFTTKGVGEGTGLGLSVAWGIVTEHGGMIRVETGQEHGTSFVVTLPRQPVTPCVTSSTTGTANEVQA